MDINPIMSIRRLFSSEDTYSSDGSCMLEDLFRHNKMRYVYAKRGTNVVRPMLIRHNLDRLAFINTSHVKLDIVSCVGAMGEAIYQVFLSKYVHKQDNV